jgi:hypothetical protein
VSWHATNLAREVLALVEIRASNAPAFSRHPNIHRDKANVGLP